MVIPVQQWNEGFFYCICRLRIVLKIYIYMSSVNEALQSQFSRSY